MAILTIALGAATAFAEEVSLSAQNTMPKGWGAGGWGSFRFVLRNTGGTRAQILSWTAHWEAAGKPFGDTFGGDVGDFIEPGKRVERNEVAILPPDAVKAAKPGNAVIVGSFQVRTDQKSTTLPFRIEVPEYVLPEALKLVKGHTVGIQLMESRFRSFKHLDRTLTWIDSAYASMIDLTGEHPFGGRLMVFKEAPPHPWWAYAGEEMILNTDYVGETLRDFDDGLISFGWVHEVGHNFDVLGDWYQWDGASTEFQANFKLAYAFEHIADQSFRIKWTFQAPGYPAPDPNTRLTGQELVDRFFLQFGDQYLADPSRKWQSLSSDELQTFFQRLQVEYGWDVFKKWYRTYRTLADKGLHPPSTAEEKISLMAAILSREAKVDLLPVFQRWRLPVTAESLESVRQKYSLERT